jgi:hypothetical protein
MAMAVFGTVCVTESGVAQILSNTQAKILVGRANAGIDDEGIHA